MKIAQLCLLALFATTIFAAAVTQAAGDDFDIPSTHGWVEAEADEVALYFLSGDEDIYLYFSAATNNDYITIAFDDPATVAAGVTVTLTVDGDGMCTSVDVLDVEFNSATAWVEDEEDGTPATLIENYAVALAARATGVCVVQITLTAGDSTANGDVTTDGADYVAGTWYSIFNTATGTDIKTNGNTLDLSAPNNYYTSSTETPDDTALDGNYRFNLWNGIWWSAADEDNTISIVTNQDDSYWQIGVETNEDQIYRVLRTGGSQFAVVLHDGTADTVGTTVAVYSSVVDEDYEDYAFVQFDIDTILDKWTFDEDYTLGYATTLDGITGVAVQLLETDTNTAGTVDNDAGTLVSGAAAASAEEEDGANFYNIAVRYEVDEGDITFDVDFSFDSLAENFVGSVLFDMGAEEDADVLTFWWLSDFHVPAMESFNGDAATDLTVADGDLKSDWAWSGYDVEIGASARFAVTRAVASPDAAVDVSFAGDDFTFSWVYYEGATRNQFATNSPSADVTVTFPEEEEEEEEESEGGEEESEEESDSASMIVSSIVSLLSLFVIFA